MAIKTLDTLELNQVSRQAGKILFALNPLERKNFFPDTDFSDESFLGLPMKSVNTRELNLDQWHRVLEEEAPSILVTGWSGKPLPAAWWQAADCPLRYVCHVTGSVRNVVPRELIAGGIPVTNWGNLISHTIAEHAMLLILGSLRNVQAWPEALKSGERMAVLAERLNSKSLRGMRVGLHGFGAIARELVQMLRPFQVELASYSYGVPAAHFSEHEVRQMPTLEALFENSDILIECEGLTERSRGIVSESLLRRLPAGALFVNIGRAQITDEAALVKVASEGHIQLALDVYHEEPLCPGSPLHSVPRGFLSPHIAGPTWDVFPECGQQVLRNIKNFIQGRPLDGLVTLPAYDRAT